MEMICLLHTRNCWLPDPSEFITFLGDLAHWVRVRQLLPISLPTD